MLITIIFTLFSLHLISLLKQICYATTITVFKNFMVLQADVYDWLLKLSDQWQNECNRKGGYNIRSLTLKVT